MIKKRLHAREDGKVPTSFLCGKRWAAVNINKHTWDYLDNFLRYNKGSRYTICQACLDAIPPLVLLAHTDL